MFGLIERFLGLLAEIRSQVVLSVNLTTPNLTPKDLNRSVSVEV